MMTLKLTLQYDGTNYVGFQRQPNGLAVQEVLEGAIGKMTQQPGFKIGAASGRTDAGVHARGQVIHFRTESTIPPDRWPYALNRFLPDDMIAVACEQVPDEFHARFWAASKRYRYTFELAPFQTPMTRLYAYHYPKPVSVAAMRAASNLLIGPKDFGAFRSTGGAAQTTTRTVSKLTLTEVGAHVFMDISADGFLYNMVRIIAGTLLEVGTGRRTLADVRLAISTGERTYAGKTLPPHGLCLEEVTYGTGPKRPTWWQDDQEID